MSTQSDIIMLLLRFLYLGIILQHKGLWFLPRKLIPSKVSIAGSGLEDGIFQTQLPTRNNKTS